MISVGIDCGAGNTKTVILSNGKIVARGAVPTGHDPEAAVKQSLEQALKTAGGSRAEIHGICGTGSGAASITMDHIRINEIDAMAKAARFFFPEARTVVDVGAEEARVATIDESGKVKDFAVNERCAAGAGAFFETMARALEVGVEEMGPLCLRSERKIPMNAQCVIFAESEVVGLIHAGTEKKDISKAVHDAVAGRIASLIRRVGINEPVMMIGGVALNPGFVESVRRELKVEGICVPEAPAFGAAVGAALAAAEAS